MTRLCPSLERLRLRVSRVGTPDQNTESLLRLKISNSNSKNSRKKASFATLLFFKYPEQSQKQFRFRFSGRDLSKPIFSLVLNYELNEYFGKVS